MRHPLIVGDATDPHVEAVVAEIAARGGKPIVLDASTLPAGRWRRSIDHFEMAVNGSWQLPNRGWLRRLAPAGHHSGIALGSLPAVEATARLALIASLSDTAIEWLTDYWSTLRAENKLVQYRVAETVGVRVPRTAVVTDPADIDPALGDPLVVKPLGLGEYRHDGVSFAVHTHLVRRDDPSLSALSVAPFIAQQRITAVWHLRVVTVGTEAWAARLDATDLPLDWRLSEGAHKSWIAAAEPTVRGMAVAVASALGLRYSSQDWIVDEDDQCWFVDGNPGGQWLFLPDEVAHPVTVAIAAWLVAS